MYILVKIYKNKAEDSLDLLFNSTLLIYFLIS